MTDKKSRQRGDLKTAMAGFLLCLSCFSVLAHADQVTLVELHGTDGRPLYINPHTVASIRGPSRSGQFRHFTPEANCAVFMDDGKNLAVRETCDQVRAKFKATQ